MAAGSKTPAVPAVQGMFWKPSSAHAVADVPDCAEGFAGDSEREPGAAQRREDEHRDQAEYMITCSSRRTAAPSGGPGSRPRSRARPSSTAWRRARPGSSPQRRTAPAATSRVSCTNTRTNMASTCPAMICAAAERRGQHSLQGARLALHRQHHGRGDQAEHGEHHHHARRRLGET